MMITTVMSSSAITASRLVNRGVSHRAIWHEVAGVCGHGSRRTTGSSACAISTGQFSISPRATPLASTSNAATKDNGKSFSSAIPKNTTTTPTTLLMGCVSYDPAVGAIWSGIQDYLVNEARVPFDYVLFTNYEAQVQSLIKGHIDIAWNGPIAHVMAEQQVAAVSRVVSLGMRDVDRDFESLVVVRKDANITSVQDMNGRILLTGASDSPQAHVVPLYHLQTTLGIVFDKVLPHDVDVGKHGDTAVGEIQAMQALLDKQGHVATISKMMWESAIEGKISSIDATKLAEACTVFIWKNDDAENVGLPKFDHCQFDVLEETSAGKNAQLNDFGEALLAMDWENPKHQKILKMEGCQRQFVGPRQSGYDIVRQAMKPAGGADWRNHVARNFSYSNNDSNKRMQSSHVRSFSTTAVVTTTTKNERVAVIGAGIAGLQALRALRGAGISNVTAFEASDKVGGLWNSNYSGFSVQVPKQLFEFQDFPMTSVKWGDYATGEQIQEYTESYVDALGLRESIRFNTMVVKVEQNDTQQSSKSWTIQTKSKDGKTESETYDYLIVATGLYSNLKKYLPPFLEKHGHVMHSSDFSNAHVANGKRVVVVGGGKSAIDCALEASKAGADSVTLLQREPHWPTPRLIAGLIPFQYIFLSRLGQALVSAQTAPYPIGTGVSINAFCSSVVGPLLMKPIFGAVEELFAFQFGLRGDLRPKKGVVQDFYDVALVLNPEFTQMRKDGKVHVQLGEIERVDDTNSKKSIWLKNGSKLDDVDLIVSATGFEQDYSIFNETMQADIGCRNDDGLYLYRGILPENVSNLAFIGHLALISNISGYGLQAEWLARILTGQMAPPTSTSMHEEIEARKKWARGWMPPSRNRGMNVLLHQTHYHDQLLRDMGENPNRKMPNIFAEMLMPYEPADYNGILGGSPK